MGYPAVMRIKGENVWVTYIKRRVFKTNNSINIVMTGETGSGKSWAMLNLAYAIDPNFSVDNVFFKLSDFVKAITEREFKRGSMVIFDEAGIDLNSSNWQNLLNKTMNMIMQTIRHRNMIICFTVPHFHFLSKGVRTLISAHWEALGYDDQNNSKIKPRAMEYNGNIDKFYRKRLMVQEGHNVYMCSLIKIKKAPNELINSYEEKKLQYTTNLYKKLRDELENYEAMSEERINKRKYKTTTMTDIQEDTLKLLKEGKTIKEISLIQRRAEGTIYKTCTSLRNKPFIKITPIKKNYRNDKGVFINNVVGYRVEDQREDKEEKSNNKEK